jgi:hypothetical protein
MWTNENRGRYDRSKLRYPSDLMTDEEWVLIGPLWQQTGGADPGQRVSSPPERAMPYQPEPFARVRLTSDRFRQLDGDLRGLRGMDPSRDSLIDRFHELLDPDRPRERDQETEAGWSEAPPPRDVR